MHRLKDRVKIIGGSVRHKGEEGEVTFIYGDNEGFLVKLSSGKQFSFFSNELEAIPEKSEVERIADAIYAEKRKDDPMTKEQALEFATGLYKAGVRHNG